MNVNLNLTLLNLTLSDKIQLEYVLRSWCNAHSGIPELEVGSYKDLFNLRTRLKEVEPSKVKDLTFTLTELQMLDAALEWCLRGEEYVKTVDLSSYFKHWQKMQDQISSYLQALKDLYGHSNAEEQQDITEI